MVNSLPNRHLPYVCFPLLFRGPLESSLGFDGWVPPDAALQSAPSINKVPAGVVYITVLRLVISEVDRSSITPLTDRSTCTLCLLSTNYSRRWNPYPIKHYPHNAICDIITDEQLSKCFSSLLVNSDHLSHCCQILIIWAIFSRIVVKWCTL